MALLRAQVRLCNHRHYLKIASSHCVSFLRSIAPVAETFNSSTQNFLAAFTSALCLGVTSCPPVSHPDMTNLILSSCARVIAGKGVRRPATADWVACRAVSPPWPIVDSLMVLAVAIMFALAVAPTLQHVYTGMLHHSYHKAANIM